MTVENKEIASKPEEMTVENDAMTVTIKEIDPRPDAMTVELKAIEFKHETMTVVIEAMTIENKAMGTQPQQRTSTQSWGTVTHRNQTGAYPARKIALAWTEKNCMRLALNGKIFRLAET